MAAADRFLSQYRAGLDIRDVLDAAEGYQALAGAVLQCAAAQDPTWPEREPVAAAFWCDVAGTSVDAFKAALRRWQAGQPVA